MKSCIIYIMGVSGSGKTTIGKRLSDKINFSFFDGDDFHSLANKEKMKAGIPLTDEDRAGWLLSINKFAKGKKEGAIIACSALKEKYRKTLGDGFAIPVYWVFLQGSFELIQKRMKERKDHFMPTGLLSSQFDTLEPPANSIIIDISKTPEEIVETIISTITKKKI